jgi:hypothetical protein
MKYPLLFLGLMCISTTIFSQPTFDFLYSSSLDETSRSLLEDQEGSIYFPIENFQYGLIIKVNNSGHFLDSVRVDNPEGTCNLGELIGINNEFFVTLGHWSNGSEYYLWFVKLDYNLQVIEDKKLDSEGWLVHNFKYIINHKGNIVFIAEYTLDGSTLEDCIYEITTDGLMINKVFFDQPSGFNQAFSIIENKFDYTYKIFTRTPLSSRVESTYNILDSNFYIINNGTFGDAIYTHNTARWINDSTYLITGKKYYLEENEWDLGILKVSGEDSILSYLYIGAPDTVEWPGLFKSLDFISIDNIFYPGSYNTYFYPWQMETNWIMLNILDSDLNIISQHYYGGDAYYAVSAVLATQDSGCVMACQRYDHLTQNNEFDVYILKVNKDGLLVSVPENPILNSSACELYPNPGKEILNIESKLNDLQIEIFDVNGRLKSYLQLESGSNKLNVSNLPRGIYLYRVFDKKKYQVQSGKWLKY